MATTGRRRANDQDPGTHPLMTRMTMPLGPTGISRRLFPVGHAFLYQAVLYKIYQIFPALPIVPNGPHASFAASPCRGTCMEHRRVRQLKSHCHLLRQHLAARFAFLRVPEQTNWGACGRVEGGARRRVSLNQDNVSHPGTVSRGDARNRYHPVTSHVHSEPNPGPGLPVAQVATTAVLLVPLGAPLLIALHPALTALENWYGSRHRFWVISDPLSLRNPRPECRVLYAVLLVG